MKSLHCDSMLSETKGRSCLCSLFFAASLICSFYFIGSESIAKEYKERLLRWGAINTGQISNSNGSKRLDTSQNSSSCRCNYTFQLPKPNVSKEAISTPKNTNRSSCENQCRPAGSESLPDGIVSRTSNLEMLPLWGASMKNKNSGSLKNLLAITVGIKQKELVNDVVKKFYSCNFVIMLFHYDGIIDEWKDLEWSDHVIHVSALNQTKWWFAKRFLHPDIVSEYDYIFLWDEDLRVENFHPGRYISIVKDEGLEISQPALDPSKSDVHHPITVRQKHSRVHRRFYKLKGHGRCNDQSRDPPCIGWVEMMAPVFSRAAWRCTWYMIQNDLIHAWGLDVQLGYCAQGDRTRKVGVVDSEYIVHLGLSTLGVSDKNKLKSNTPVPTESKRNDHRLKVRWQSFTEMKIFKKRWENAVKEEKCWVDPYKQAGNTSSH